MSLLEIDEDDRVFMLVGREEFDDLTADEQEQLVPFWDEAKRAYAFPLEMTAEAAKAWLTRQGWSRMPMTDETVKFARRVALKEH